MPSTKRMFLFGLILFISSYALLQILADHVVGVDSGWLIIPAILSIVGGIMVLVGVIRWLYSFLSRSI